MSASTVRLVDSDAEGGSQAVKAQQRLREWILAGDLPSGARIAELALVDRLGMSRTPIRAALMHLKQEGLLEPLSGGGYAVRTFSEREVADAIEQRAGQTLGSQGFGPFVERQIAGDQGGTALIALRDQLEQQLRAGL